MQDVHLLELATWQW